MIRRDETQLYRWVVASRVVAAPAGCYALVVPATMMLARLLPLSRSEAATAATIAGVLIMPAGIIWVFATRSAGRAWAGLIAVTLLCALIAWTLGQPG